MKKTYLWNFFAGIFFLVPSSNLLVVIANRYKDAIFPEEYPVIGSFIVADFLGFFAAAGFFLGITPFILFTSSDKQTAKRIIIWIVTIVLSFFLFLILRRFVDDLIQSLTLIVFLYFLSGIQLGIAVMERFKDILKQVSIQMVSKE